MESTSFSQHCFSTDIVTSSVPPSVASSSEESSNDCTAPWKADIAFSMNGATSPHTTIFHSEQQALVELPRSLARPSRESVLQRLSESLLRRSLTKVCPYENFGFDVSCCLFCRSLRGTKKAILISLIIVSFSKSSPRLPRLTCRNADYVRPMRVSSRWRCCKIRN